jgi:hypothetical protein
MSAGVFKLVLLGFVLESRSQDPLDVGDFARLLRTVGRLPLVLETQGAKAIA